MTNFQKDFVTTCMDPTETTQFPDILKAIELPNKTGGYQRAAMGVMSGTLAGTGNQPRRTRRRRSP